jgi:SAM-dependent methyltransferase
MSTCAALKSPVGRTPWQGARQILRFNWPKYAGAMVLLAMGVMALPLVWGEPWVVLGVVGVLGALLWWTAASILASHWVYDRSGLFGLGWMSGVVSRPTRWASVHAGLDEFAVVLRRALGEPVAVLDIHDPETMTEGSIRRAAGLLPADPRTRRCTFERLEVADESVDAMFVLFAAHELRRHEERAALFREIGRTLAPGGHLLVVEHLRDRAGFIAFGPGVLHFHSRSTWLRAFAAGGLRVVGERRITPFARVFVLGRSA